MCFVIKKYLLLFILQIGSPLKQNNDFGDFDNPEEEEMALHKMNCRYDMTYRVVRLVCALL